MKILKNKINDPMLGFESHMGGQQSPSHKFYRKESLWVFSFYKQPRIKEGGSKYLKPLELEKRCVL